MNATAHDTLAFDPAVCTARLAASGQVWWPVQHWAETDSTQQQIRLQVQQEPQPLHAFRLGVAEAQTAGRGRGGAQWHAPAGSGLLMTLGGAVRLPVAHWPRLSLLAGLAVLDALELPNVRLKWPNDLVVLHNGRWHKLAGLLCECVQRPGTEPAWLCGIGLNLAHGKDFPRPDGLPAVGLADLGLAPRRDELAARLAVRVRSQVESQASSGRWPAAELDAALAFVGTQVAMDLGATTELVTLLGLTADGGVRWRDAQGLEQAGVPLAVRPTSHQLAQPHHTCDPSATA